ncbi:MAG: hypothetical protein ACWA5X_02150 [bacterium]
MWGYGGVGLFFMIVLAPASAGSGWQQVAVFDDSGEQVIFQCEEAPKVATQQRCEFVFREDVSGVVGIDGGMPVHGHGLPTAPEVSPKGVAGHYRISGLRYSMPGEWVVACTITAEGDGKKTKTRTARFVFDVSF